MPRSGRIRASTPSLICSTGISWPGCGPVSPPARVRKYPARGLKLEPCDPNPLRLQPGVIDSHHLIRSSGQLVQSRPSWAVRWADIPGSSLPVGRCLAVWQQYWQQRVPGFVRGKPLGARAGQGRQWTVAWPDDLIRLAGGGRTAVHRRGSVVIRAAGPWTPAVHALLRHLQEKGFAAAPRLAGPGLDQDGRELLTFIDGEFTQPGPWSLAGAAALGALLRDLHQATRTFRPPAAAVWFPWHGRDLGGPHKIIGHCDVAPWNIVARDGRPVALIDGETAGPVDPLVELAQLCWLNAKLHDDTVAQREHLPPAGPASSPPS
jgi:hypothetical protein